MNNEAYEGGLSMMSEYTELLKELPLIIRGVGVVGNITVSGLPQQEDHEPVVTMLKQFVASDTQ